MCSAYGVHKWFDVKGTKSNSMLTPLCFDLNIKCGHSVIYQNDCYIVLLNFNEAQANMCKIILIICLRIQTIHSNCIISLSI